MSLYAIAYDKLNKQIRLFDTDKSKFKDVSEREIEAILNHGATVENLKIQGGKIKWSSGTVDRYTNIGADGQIVNANTAVVTGVSDGANKTYRLTNYEGRTAYIDESKTLAFAANYGLANCKLVTKDGKQFIQSIAGEIPTLSSKASYIIKNFENLYITLPADGSVTELVVEDYINGVSVERVNMIVVEPAAVAARIKKITFPKKLRILNSMLFTTIPNVETVISFNADLYVCDNCFFNCKKLKEFYALKIECIAIEAFKGCKELEKVYFKLGCKYINSKAFYGCTKLNIQALLDCKPTYLYINLFNGASAETLKLSDETLMFHATTFEGVKGLKDIYLDGVTTTITESGKADADGKYFGWFSGTIHAYSQSKAISSKHSRLSDSVNIDIIDNDDKSASLNKSLLKSRALGVGVTDSLEVTSFEDSVNLMRTCSPEEIRAMAVKYLNGCKGYTDTIPIKIGNFSLKMCIGFSNYDFNRAVTKAKDIYEVEHALCLGNNKHTALVCYDKNFVINYLDYESKRKDWHSYSRTKVYIPYVTLDVAGKVKGIQVTDEGHYIVQFRNGDRYLINCNTLETRKV